MLIGRMKPDYDICCSCIDIQADRKQYKDCGKCVLNCVDYQIIKVGTTVFGRDYAMILKDGKIKKVPLDMLHHVKNIDDVFYRLSEEEE